MAGRGVTVDFNANIARFTSSVDKMTNDLSKFQSNAARIGKNIDSIFSGIGVGLSVGGIAAFGKSVIDNLDKINDLSKTTGLAVNTLSGLDLAARQSGANLDSVAASVSKLAVNMGKDSEKFRQLGITAKDPLEAFKQLSDIFVSIQDPQQRAAVAAEALGKSWQETAPLLSEGGDAVGRMVSEGEKASGVTTKMAEEADKFNDQLELLKTNVSGVATSLLGELLPALNNTFKNLKNIFPSEEGMKITVRLNDLRRSMDEILFRRQLIGKTGIDSSGFWAADMEKLNAEALALEKSLVKLQSTAALPVSAPKVTSQSSISSFLGNSAAIKGQKEAQDALKRLAEMREQTLQHEIDVELAQFNKFYSDKEKAAKQSQEALDNLMREGENLKLAVDPFYKINKEIERYSELLNASAIDQHTFDLAVKNSMGKGADVVKDSVDKMSASMIGFQTNVQSTLGQGLYNAMTGRFDNIFDAWKDLLFRMISAGVASHLTDSIFGVDGKGGFLKAGASLLGSIFSSLGGPKAGALGSSTFGQSFWPIPKFATGGDFGGGLRLVGERGPELEVTGPSRIFNASQTKDILRGGGRSVVVNYNPVVNIDSRSDRASIIQDMERVNKRGQAELVDRLTRQGVL
jgi:hypothetical protein